MRVSTGERESEGGREGGCDSTKQKTETCTIDESLISGQKSRSNSFLLSALFFSHTVAFLHLCL